MEQVAIYMGRFNPVHTGHEDILRHLEANYENFLVGLGSANAPISWRNYFNYHERREFLRILYQDLPVIGLSDCPGDNDLWFAILKDIVQQSFNSLGWLQDPQGWVDGKVGRPKCGDFEITFVGGSQEDLSFAIERGYNVDIINRFDGNNVSSSEVRDALLYGRSLEGKVNSKIVHRVQQAFAEKLEIFKKV